MRKLKIIEHISLDGVIQVSGDDGDFPNSDPMADRLNAARKYVATSRCRRRCSSTGSRTTSC